MADDKTKRGQPDRSLINTSEDYELQYWATKLGVSKDRIKEAVKQVGNSAEAVTRFLRG